MADLFYGQRYSATVLDDAVDFVKLAEAWEQKEYVYNPEEEFKRCICERVNRAE